MLQSLLTPTQKAMTTKLTQEQKGKLVSTILPSQPIDSSELFQASTSKVFNEDTHFKAILGVGTSSSAKSIHQSTPLADSKSHYLSIRERAIELQVKLFGTSSLPLSFYSHMSEINQVKSLQYQLLA